MSDRSPRYPYCSLPVAIDLIRLLWGKQGSSSATSEEIAQFLGYKGMNGISRGKLSALKKYGLLDASGGGWKLSHRAIVIVNSDNGDPSISKAIQEAFDEVELFKILMESHSSASIGMITTYLMSSQGFTKDGALAAAEAFLESKTLAGTNFSHKTPAGNVDETKEDGPPDGKKPPAGHSTGTQTLPPKPVGVIMEELKIPCSNGACVELRYPSAMSQADYDLVDGFLKVFWPSKKHVLIKSVSETKTEAAQQG